MGKEKISKREIEKKVEDFWKNKGYAFGTIDILLLGEDEAGVASELFATFRDRGLVES